VTALTNRQRLAGTLFRLLIGPANQQLFDTLDWDEQCRRLATPELTYPAYYTQPNFHGIEGGYLTAIAAVSYDAVTALASPPNETWVRQQGIEALLGQTWPSPTGQPQQILDMGCGTGSSTLLLKQTFPSATVTGIDLSPFMLVMAQHKAQTAGLTIHWLQALAEATGLEANRFDLITAAFLFHETPPTIAQHILQESFRLLKPGGRVLVLDGNQPRLRHAGWLIRLFREPYSQPYAAGDVAAWMQAAAFTHVKTRYFGWIHQLTQGVKP
jgi:ubiquinone/menaquinone biosynthesis C-methylase UbiE